MKKVEVFWLDALMEVDPMNGVGVQDLSPVVRSNVGYLQELNDEEIKLSFGLMYSEDTYKIVTFTIPIGMVVYIREIC